MGLFSFLFKNKSQAIANFLERNPIIIDVRTASEYQRDHLKGAIHIPLQQINNEIPNLSAKKRPIIVHCQSGIRSAQAASILKKNGLEAINGGGISKMKKLLA
jgi:rhodanese-related sulfurtransferase